VNKPLLGLVLGGALGILDGLSALLSAPSVAPQLLGIVVGSTIKGLVVGVLVGWFATRVRSTTAGLVVGLLVGLGFAWLVAAMPDESGQHYYWEIMLPGSIVGLIVGWATQRYGNAAARKPA
jgi:hypothetical protein